MNTRHREKETAIEMSGQQTQRKDLKVTRNDDGKPGQKQLKLTEAMATETATQNTEAANQASPSDEVLAELRKLRQENATSFQELKDSSNRLETIMEELKQKTECLDQRLTEAETRVSKVEHGHRRHERALGYRLRKRLI